jgi:hypothetical protein
MRGTGFKDLANLRLLLRREVNCNILRPMNFTRTLSVESGFAVIIAGGGPSGCAAATAAARQGAKTLLLESTSTLGGIGTSGLIPAWCPFTDHEQIVYRSIALEILEASKAGVPHVKPDALDWVPINPEHLKRVYDDKVSEAGVEVRFMSSLCAVEMGGDGDVDALVVSSKLGLTALKAKTYIDATGDADLCHWAGAPTAKGGPNGELQPSSLCFILSNVDQYLYHGPLFHEHFFKEDTARRFPFFAHFCNNPIGPGTAGFNAGHVRDVDNTDPRSVTRGIMRGRKLAVEFLEALRELRPEVFANAFLAATAPMLGTRESRRVVGDYVLNVDDYHARRSFDDEVARNAYPLDQHTAQRQADELLAGKFISPMDHHGKRYGRGDSHGIPYRSLIPQKLNNVLVAGRCFSTDRLVQSATRAMPPCLATGEAAGVAASLAARSNGRTRDVDTNELRAILKQNGAYIH